ncbi:MAG TPA: hypothetical protein VHP56_05935 [Solirubrobacterales bacterium]|jgi:hypothetical protein|nr:hypothetical protein [Solirubrobacterales bacterium]
MAGDIGIEESVVVLPPTEKRELAPMRALAPVLAAAPEPTGVLHHYGPRVLIGELPQAAPPLLAEALPDVMLSPESEAPPPPAKLDLDAAGQAGLEAFELRQSSAYAAAKEARPLAGAPWDTEQGETPGCAAGAGPSTDGAPGAPLMGAPPPFTSERLVGSVAVGIIVVSGPTPDLQFSEAEYVKIVAEVQNGLGWLGSQSVGGGVSWFYDLRKVSLTTPAVSGGNWSEQEERWRNPTMEALGHTGDWQGLLDYVEEIRTNLGTRWAYCGLFTKYPVFHFGYAAAPRIVMQAPYDGWGPDNIDRVFAHETGHIFGAPDEYPESQCDCGGNFGIFGRPNANCANCGPGIECLMIKNSWSMCAWTPWHLSLYWPAGLTINGNDSTPAAPSAVTFNDKLHLAWKANDPSNAIYCSASADGLTWPAGQRINQSDSTPEPPAMATFDGKLYLFWKANDPSNSIHFSASSDGVTWPAGQRINQVDSTPTALAAASFGDKLYLFWKANDPSNSIYFSASSDGVTWPAGQRINEADSTSAAVAVAEFRGRLYVFWKANDPSNTIFYSASSDGASWPAGSRINDVDSTSASPAVVNFEGWPYLFWKANDPSNKIHWSVTNDGASWPAGQQINGRDSTPMTPAPAVFRDQLNLAWTANDPSGRIYSSVYKP